MGSLPFFQLDVFSAAPFRGNPLAVIAEADALSEEQMRSIANWTNLSETTFLMQPNEPSADYKVRIFTPDRELPFAGHPTLGSCQAWLALGNKPKTDVEVIQECEAGLVKIKRDGARLAFAAPPLLRFGEVEPDILNRIGPALGIAGQAIRAAHWVDNGPGWIGVLLGSRAEVLNVRRDPTVLYRQPLGVVAPWNPAQDGDAAQFEVRAFTMRGVEDPVTGSLNAGLAQWLIRTGIARQSYVAAQGAMLGRDGRVHISQEGATLWVGGHVGSCISGRISVCSGLRPP